jgi:hypothetical protein
MLLRRPGSRDFPHTPCSPQDTFRCEVGTGASRARTHRRRSWSQREASASTKVRTRSRSIAIRCKPSSVRTVPPKTSLDSQCPLAGIGRGTERGAWLDAPPFAAKPQVQGRLASGEEFGLSCEYAPAARAIKPNSLARTRSGRLAHSRSVYRERSVVGFAR